MLAGVPFGRSRQNDKNSRQIKTLSMF